MESIVATKYDVTTLLGSRLALSVLCPVNFDSDHQYTLNNYLNVFPNESFTAAPRLKYFGVGIQGFYNVDSGQMSSPYRPQRTNMNMYTPIPIRCRPVDEDLSDADRKLYRLRQRKTINGQDYYLYWLKVIDFGDTVKFKRINTLTGAEEAYELNSANLTPTPVKTGSDETIDSSSSTIVAYVDANVSLMASEIAEYINVAYGGDLRKARISEIGLYTGVDKEVTSTSGQGTPITYTESIFTMFYNHQTNLGTDLSDPGASLNTTIEITSRGSILSEDIS